MNKKNNIVVSGIRPTGKLHLGNYFGAIKNFIKLQEDYSCFFFVADLHYLTTHTDTKTLTESSYAVIAEYLACGINPEKSVIYLQSTVPEVAELYLYLNMLAYKGELEKTASFKEKIKLHKENINAGLLTYPVLMAADILIHRGEFVPVGKDQEQHLEMARNFASRFNFRFQTQVLPEPVAFNFNQALVKIPALDNSGKMSKSENVNATIYLTDTAEQVNQKVKRATTDSGPTTPNSPMPDSIQNLFTLLSVCSDEKTVQELTAQYNDCTIRYGDLKQTLAENLNHFLDPIREKILELQGNKKLLADVVYEGGMKAKFSAQQTLKMVREAMCFQ